MQLTTADDHCRWQQEAEPRPWRCPAETECTPINHGMTEHKTILLKGLGKRPLGNQGRRSEKQDQTGKKGTSHTGRSSWRVKRRSQEENVVEQVTFGDSEPVSTSSVLTQKISISLKACTDMNCQSNTQILPFRDGWEKENY